MISAITTRFRCRCPLTDLFEKTLMFDTLILQYLNKLVERKVGNFTSPKAFHTVKVQRFNRNRIKLLTEFACELPMKVFTLIANFPIQTCELSNTTPPTVRTFGFTRKAFVEGSQLLQGLFERLRVLLLFTRAKCQVSVFHTEICPNALTCCWQRFEVGIGRCYAKPIVATSITLDCDTTDSSMPLTVFMKRIRHFIKTPLTFITLTECEGDTIVSEFVSALFKSDRLKLMARFDMRFTAEFIKEPLIRIINAFQLCLNRLGRQQLLMWMCGSFQIFGMFTHCSVVRIRQAVFVSLVLPLMEIGMHLPHIVKQVAKTYRIGLIVYLILIGFHGLSSIKSLTPFQWVGRHVTLRLR